MSWIEWLIMKSGLMLNLIGGLMMAFSIGKNPGGAYQGDTYLASILYPKMFWCGVITLISGFVMSLIAEYLVSLILQR
jgi:hypothetical protein